ncbi:MAG: tRNA preQ1(34) S-adenosylmethionine ribosyltransferase-isomerase QueA [Chlamydiota bacterium]|nr:tRNA preQ1(34) S-adenosylmethionine ribosyltransferase-isomerase QueA [Chlamydiota bacterium]
MTKNLFDLASYHYDFDESLIAKYPANPRDSSRLMIVDRVSGNITEKSFKQITEILQPDDSIVFNDTRVIPARLLGTRPCGGKAEIFLVKPVGVDTWEVLAKPGKKLREGTCIKFSENFRCYIVEICSDGSRIVKFTYDGDFDTLLQKYGQIPLPQYIDRKPDEQVDSERYQTVYANEPGAVAAPTAGLHFTDEILRTLSSNGIHQDKVTLHVGLGTFQPVRVEDVREHQMHTERCVVLPETAKRLNTRKPGSRQVCVGTTCCRVLESASNENGIITPGNFETDIFIYPGYKFKYVDCLLTNFHLPSSTLLMLVSAFAGYDLIMEAYKKAVKDRYRFFSYGDAMLIL